MFHGLSLRKSLYHSLLSLFPLYVSSPPLERACVVYFMLHAMYKPGPLTDPIKSRLATLEHKTLISRDFDPWLFSSGGISCSFGLFGTMSVLTIFQKNKEKYWSSKLTKKTSAFQYPSTYPASVWILQTYKYCKNHWRGITEVAEEGVSSVHGREGKHTEEEEELQSRCWQIQKKFTQRGGGEGGIVQPERFGMLLTDVNGASGVFEK